MDDLLQAQLEQVFGGSLDASALFGDILGGFAVDSVSLPNLDPAVVQAMGLIPSASSDHYLWPVVLKSLREFMPIPVEVYGALYGASGWDPVLWDAGQLLSSEFANNARLGPGPNEPQNMIAGVYQRLLGNALGVQAVGWQVRSAVHRYALEPECWTATWGGMGRCGDHVLVAPIGEAPPGVHGNRGALWLFEPSPSTAAGTWKPGRP